ncbi:MAG: TetR/AcrR family transcriptional regulator [Bacteroidota bacterium]
MEIKESIIQTADRLFMAYGFKRITMDEIASELGISKKTIYQYFKDKKEVVYEVTKASLEEEKNIIEETTQRSENAIEELFLISQRIRQKHLQMNPYILSDLRKYYHNAWQLFLNFKKEMFHDCIKNLIDKGIKEGYFRPEINSEILTVMRLEQAQMVFDTELFHPEKFEFKEVQIQLLDHFVHGILTDSGRALHAEYLKNQTYA